MPPLPKGEALAGRKAQKTPFRRLQLREGVFFPWDDESVIAFTIFSICHSPQKSSTTQKVYKRLRGQGPSLYNLSVSLRSTAPLVGEPLAKPFTLRGMPKPPLGRSNGDDRRQRRKQGGAVGAAASRMQATAKQTLGAATRAVALRSNDGEVIPLFCKNPLQTSPRCGIIHLVASPLRIEYLPL